MANTIDRVHIERVKYGEFGFADVHFQRNDLVAICELERHDL